jgi:hypothetical protein
LSVPPLLAAARGVQLDLERFYDLEPGPDVADFVRPGSETTRESLLLRDGPEDVELALLLPQSGGEAGAIDDAYLQVVEGVSHFVYVAERVRVGLPTTELELELQAEVDKFVLLAFDGEDLVSGRAVSVRQSLYEDVDFIHSAESVHGRRYRLANALAARLSSRLVEGRFQRNPRAFLQRFYRAGQSDKIRIAQA